MNNGLSSAVGWASLYIAGGAGELILCIHTNRVFGRCSTLFCSGFYLGYQRYLDTLPGLYEEETQRKRKRDEARQLFYQCFESRLSSFPGQFMKKFNAERRAKQAAKEAAVADEGAVYRLLCHHWPPNSHTGSQGAGERQLLEE